MSLQNEKVQLEEKVKRFRKDQEELQGDIDAKRHAYQTEVDRMRIKHEGEIKRMTDELNTIKGNIANEERRLSDVTKRLRDEEMRSTKR